jgi:glycosyltransferase involved in cell wall biosynthesis
MEREVNNSVVYTKKVSVIMPVYNCERYLDKCINSVLNQSLKDIEFIIINDGSTDKTKNIIKKYAAIDNRIVYLENKVNQTYFNLHNTINKCFKIAKGKYLTLLSGDDIWMVNKLEKQYNYLEKNKDIFLVGTSTIVINEEGRKIGEFKKKNYPSILFKYNLVNSNSFVFSSIMFRNEGFLFPNCEERFFYFLLLTKGKKLKNMTDFLTIYRINTKGVSADILGMKSHKKKD